MKAKKWVSLLAAALALMVAVSACGQGATPSPAESGDTPASSGAGDSSADTPAAPADDGKMTEVGTPRSETLIVDMLSGRSTNPDLFNWYMPGCVPGNTSGPFLGAHLW